MPPRKSARLAAAVAHEADEAPLYALPKDPPARQVLQASELVKIIVGFLNTDMNAFGKNKKALAGLMTVNWPFFHASTDILWASMHSVSPFIKLLPPSKPTGDLGPKALILSIKSDPWSRFRVYAHKTRSLELIKDTSIELHWPKEWFFFLFQLPSRPALLFPNLTKLTIFSIDGINFSLPFHLLSNLQDAYISDLGESYGKWSASRKSFVSSLMAAFASNSPQLWNITLNPTLSKQMAVSFPEMSALTILKLTLSTPVELDDLVFLNTLPRLETLFLATQGSGNKVIYPRAREHLAVYHPKQGQSKITTLNLGGNPFFIFWATSFFCSRFLHTFVAKIWTTLDDSTRPGLLLMPRILHLVLHSNPEVRQFSIEWDGELHGDEEWDRGDARLEIPEEFFDSLGGLQSLEILIVKNIPILRADFLARLFAGLPCLTSLHTLCLVPRHINYGDNLKLIRIQSLATLPEEFPSLQHLTIPIEDIDKTPPDATEMADAEHGLKSLFIVPRFGELEATLPSSQLISLATYLDSLFPRLVDVTSYFEPMDRLKKGGQNTSRTLRCWKGLDSLLKSYQRIRTRSVGRNLLDSHPGDS